MCVQSVEMTQFFKLLRVVCCSLAAVQGYILGPFSLQAGELSYPTQHASFPKLLYVGFVSIPTKSFEHFDDHDNLAEICENLT